MPEEAKKTSEMFDMLLGDNLTARKSHIEEFGHLYIEELDVD